MRRGRGGGGRLSLFSEGGGWEEPLWKEEGVGGQAQAWLGKRMTGTVRESPQGSVPLSFTRFTAFYTPFTWLLSPPLNDLLVKRPSVLLVLRLVLTALPQPYRREARRGWGCSGPSGAPDPRVGAASGGGGLLSPFFLALSQNPSAPCASVWWCGCLSVREHTDPSASLPPSPQVPGGAVLL